MFFKCFHELSAALTRNSYRGKVLQQQLKVLSQTFYVSCCSGKHKVAARNSHKACVPALTQEQHSRMTAFNPIKPHKFRAGQRCSIYKIIRRARTPSSTQMPCTRTAGSAGQRGAPHLHAHDFAACHRDGAQGSTAALRGRWGQGCCRSHIRILAELSSQPHKQKKK